MHDGFLKERLCCESPNNVDYSRLLLHLKELHLESLRESVTWRLPFSNLTCLKVKSCNSFSYLFKSSIARSLTKLQKMDIIECESIEEIVSKKEGEESNEDEIIFPHLSCLNLETLGRLRWFYQGSLTFTLLEELSITNCKEMVTLCACTLEAVKLSEVIINFHKCYLMKTDLNSTILEEFLEEVRVSFF